MGYTLTFSARSSGLPRADLRAWFAARPGYVDTDDETFGYVNELTGVYFKFEWVDEALQFEVNLLRPPTFALEAADELTALCDAFPLRVEDVQGGIEGDRFDRDSFVSAVNGVNGEFAYKSRFIDVGEEPPSLPREKLERFWRWNRAYDQLVRELGKHYFVANAAMVILDGTPALVAFWPDRRSILLPTVDHVVLSRNGEQRIVAWDALAERIPALRDQPDPEPSEHRAIVSGLAAGWDEAWRRGSAEVPPLVDPAEIHAVEDVERGKDQAGDDRGRGMVEPETDPPEAEAMPFETFGDLCAWLEEHHEAERTDDGNLKVVWEWSDTDRTHMVLIEEAQILDEAWIYLRAYFAPKDQLTLEKAWAMTKDQPLAQLVEGPERWHLLVAVPLDAVDQTRLTDLIQHLAANADDLEEAAVGSDEL